MVFPATEREKSPFSVSDLCNRYVSTKLKVSPFAITKRFTDLSQQEIHVSDTSDDAKLWWRPSLLFSLFIYHLLLPQ